MRRGIASLWHATSLVIAGVLYFLFVIPRWYELTGQWPVTLGTVMRILCGVLVGLTALPVLLTLRRTRRPELGTPVLALQLRVWSIVGHVAAAVLIVGAAVSEIWLDLDTAGQWLFGCYGAAAALALLGAFAFQLAFVAELPPPPPKPLSAKPQNRRRGGGDEGAETTAESVESTESAESGEPETTGSDEDQPSPEDSQESEPGDPEPDDEEQKNPVHEGKLRNHRPTGKTRRTRTRGGVATEE